MVGAVGADADGAAMLVALRDAGVDVSAVATVEEPTGTALIVVDADGENQIAVCEGANAFVSADGVEFTSTDAVLAQLEIPLAAIERLAARVQGYFALNAAPARTLPRAVVDRADLIIVNESEYALLPQLADARLVAVTYGAQGAALFERGVRIAFAPAVVTAPVNTVGAGDAFCAALVLALRSGQQPEQSLATACAVGAAAVADPASQPKFDGLAAYTD